MGIRRPGNAAVMPAAATASSELLTGDADDGLGDLGVAQRPVEACTPARTRDTLAIFPTSQ